MLRNFIITSLRILWRNKLVSAINILSLSIGITAFLLILLYVHHETSYDKFNENYDRIYRLEGDEFARLPKVVGDHLRGKIPEIESIAQLQYGKIQPFINVDEEDPSSTKVQQFRVLRADSALFNVFTLPFLRGNPRTALNEPFTIVLTQNTAKRLFGNEDPIGKTIILESIIQSNNQYKVTGIMQNVEKGHVGIDALISLESARILYPQFFSNSMGDRFSCGTYLLLRANANPNAVDGKVNEILSEINDGELIRRQFERFHLEPLSELYLNSKATSLQYGEFGNGEMIIPFIVVALMILCLAIVNYINLTTARSTLRSKEVILKKVMGSGKNLLRLQFIIESVIISFISCIMAFTIVQLIFPKFNQLLGVNINLHEYSSPIYWSMLLVAILLIGFISGLYPAMILTSFRTVANIRSESLSGARGTLQRQVLLSFQLCISIVLIVGLITNLRQLEYVKNERLGFNKEQVVLINHPYDIDDATTYRKNFKERLEQYASIINIGTTNRRFGEQEPGHTEFEINGEQKYFQYFPFDPDYLDVMEIRLVDGRNFSRDRPGDQIIMDDSLQLKTYPVIINETAARKYWDESPIGKLCYFGNSREGVRFEIIGVVEDFHFRSMHHKVEPMIFNWRADYSANMLIRVSPENIQSTIRIIEKEWKNVYGAEPFIYSFLDEAYEQQYRSDERAATIIGYFTILAIIIACMGLFGLSSFMAVRRTKEIGIRKALGASSKTIFVMLSREYIKWILLSAIIATPIAWYAMNKWLETFAYRIELGPWVFILAAFIALAIGLITVGWQALKSAVANPVEALRYE